MATTPKRVAIVDPEFIPGTPGAGPSGLVAAKSLLHDHAPGTFDPVIFEKSAEIGGLWPASEASADGLVHPEMCTNQSRCTVSFSDLAWEDGVGMFPKAWQVGRYLKRYAERFLGSTGVEVRTGWKVRKAVRERAGTWNVGVEEVRSGKSEALRFDHLIVASGFFGKPRIPERFSSIPDFGPKVVHSSQFRNVVELLRGQKPGKIVVVGGQMSGVEVAASVAGQLSSEIWSPGTGNLPNAEAFDIHHVISRPLWIMPLYLPSEPTVEESTETSSPSYNPATAFLPLDLASYDLAKRPAGPFRNTSGRIEAKTCTKFNEVFGPKLGSDQSELAGDALAMRGEIAKKPAWVAVSDHYSEFVRSGNIKLHTGRVTGISQSRTGNPDDLWKLTITSESGDEDLENVTAVILASGFDATASISFLSEEILETLQFDATYDSFPIDLQCHSTVHKDIPDLGFVGFYRSPYWGVMEMQARFLGKLWTGATDISRTLHDHQDIATLRKCYREEPGQLSQFPMGDYAYLMESFAEATGITRTPWPPVDGNEEPDHRAGPVLPQRYSYESLSNPDIRAALSSIAKAFEASEQGRFVARAIMRALQGRWNVSRRFHSRDPLHPSGHFSGTADVHPRAPTSADFDLESLYREEGRFTTDAGLSFDANRRYIHRYRESTDTLSLWFVQAEDAKRVDYLFHAIDIVAPEAGTGDGWRGRADHWCEPDQYHVEYEWRFRGVGVAEWRMEYSVRGPKKDYTITSTYQR